MGLCKTHSEWSSSCVCAQLGDTHIQAVYVEHFSDLLLFLWAVWDYFLDFNVVLQVLCIISSNATKWFTAVSFFNEEPAQAEVQKAETHPFCTALQAPDSQQHTYKQVWPIQAGNCRQAWVSRAASSYQAVHVFTSLMCLSLTVDLYLLSALRLVTA